MTVTEDTLHTAIILQARKPVQIGDFWKSISLLSMLKANSIGFLWEVFIVYRLIWESGFLSKTKRIIQKDGRRWSDASGT